MKLSVLKTNQNNPRICKDDKFFKLVNSILEFPKMMELRPMVYDEENIIQGGNMRSKALLHIKSEGKEKALKHLESVGKPENISFFESLFLKGEIPDSWAKKATDLTEEEKRRFIIADNVGFGEWDNDMLANEWDSGELEAWGLDLPDFDEKKKEVEEDNFEEDENIETDIQYGDMFQIGNHFLLCGDATKKEDCEKLLQGNKADLIFTDPPYDLEDSYSQNIFDSAKDDSHIFVMNSDKKLIEIINNGFNIFHGFFAVDFRQAHLIANNAPMTRIDLIAEFRTGKGKFNNLHDGFSTLIECAKIHNDNEKINFGHKQAKKIELPSTFIQHYSNKNEIVADFFGGSGSTMAASEQLERICYMMEFDPKNCQIILDRMKKCYNLDANKLN